MKKKSSTKYIRQPEYFKDFRCVGGDCMLDCCSEWGGIIWTTEERDKVLNAHISDRLRELAEIAFIPANEIFTGTPGQYCIKYTAEGICPFRMEDGLCIIQKELGEEYLSHTCKIYPRRQYYCGNVIMQTCYLTCVHVTQMICSSENAMKLETVPLRKNLKISRLFKKVDMIKKPELKYHLEMFDFFYEILSSDSQSVETSIVLCAVCAEDLDEFIKNGQADKIPDILKMLKKQINDPVQIKKLENAKPNLSLKANFAAGLLKLLKGSDIYKKVFDNGLPSEEKWNEGVKMWNETFADRPYALKNIVLNIFISQRMPFRNKDMTIFENISYLAAEISVIKFLAVVAYTFEYTEIIFDTTVSYIDRNFSHSVLNFKTVMDYMRAFGVTSPAYLLGILK